MKIRYPLIKAELHIWDWKQAHCTQRILLGRGNEYDIGAAVNGDINLVWHKNSIRILLNNACQCLSYHKGENDTAYRLSSVVGIISPNLQKLSLQGTRGLATEQHHLLKAQGAQGKARVFAHIVNDEQVALEEKKELEILLLCRKNLTIQRDEEYECPALFEPQKKIYSNRWQVILFRIMESKPQSRSNVTSTTQTSTSQGAIDFHVYGFIEGLDATGRSIMIQFDLVEDREGTKYARIKNKCIVSTSYDLTKRKQAFMKMFNQEKNLPTKLCIRIAGSLTGQQRDKLLDVIIGDQQRQFEEQDMWQERRIRYKKTGGSENDMTSTVFSANCLTWLRRILKPYKLSLPHSVWDNVMVNPKHTLSAGGFFRRTSSKVCDVSDWGKSATDTATKSYK